MLRNLATNRRRDERRRREHEGEAGPRRLVPSPDTLAQDAEMQRHLAEAVTQLAEPLRSVVVLRYLHGLDSATIARELALPASTVRSRLAKALEELRATLDRRWAGGREAWSVALVVLARRGKAATGTAAAASPIGSHTLTSLGWLAATSGALLLAFLSAMHWNERESARGSSPVEANPASQAAAPDVPLGLITELREPERIPLVAGGLEVAARSEERVDFALARQNGAPPEIRGRVLSPHDLRPLAGAPFSAWLIPFEEGRVHSEWMQRGACDGDGCFHFPTPPAGILKGVLLFESPDAMRLLQLGALPPGRGLELGDILLEATRRVTVRLFDPLHVAIPGGSVMLDAPGELATIERTDADGNARLAIPLSGGRVRCFAQRFAECELDVVPDRTQEVTLEPASSLDVAFVPRGDPQDLSVIVTSGLELFPPVDRQLVLQQGSPCTSGTSPGTLRYGLQPGQDLRLYGLIPGVPFQIEVQDLAGRTLATRSVALAAREWRRLEIPLDP